MWDWSGGVSYCGGTVFSSVSRNKCHIWFTILCGYCKSSTYLHNMITMYKYCADHSIKLAHCFSQFLFTPRCSYSRLIYALIILSQIPLKWESDNYVNIFTLYLSWPVFFKQTCDVLGNNCINRSTYKHVL